jgi:hypothetical protein
MIWAEHVTRIPEGKRSLRRSRLRCNIILKLILEREDEMAWTGLIWLKIGIGG